MKIQYAVIKTHVNTDSMMQRFDTLEDALAFGDQWADKLKDGDVMSCRGIPADEEAGRSFGAPGVRVYKVWHR